MNLSDNNIKAIFLIILGMFVFAIQDSLIKLISDSINIYVIYISRSLIGITAILFYCKINNIKSAIIAVRNRQSLAVSRTIDYKLRPEQQNAIEIATQAGRLFDQFVNLTDDLLKVGNQLNTVKGSYDSTMKKLTGQGNLIKKVESIRKLGIKQRKHINEKLLQKAAQEEEEE